MHLRRILSASLLLAACIGHAEARTTAFLPLVFERAGIGRHDQTIRVGFEQAVPSLEQVRAHAIQLRAARNPNGAVTVFYYPTMDRNAFSLAYAMIEIDATGSVTTQWAKPENLELYDPIRQ
jgi:hypothetical protein